MTVMETDEASTLALHVGPAALSLPATHPNGRSHVGQPVPTYSTVLLAVWPHVVSVSVPPSGVADPSDSMYSSRGPGKKARSPALHVPAVYMAGWPDTALDSRGATPDVPESAVMAGSPRHSGCVGDGERVAAGVADDVALPVGVRVSEVLLVSERVPDALGVAVRVADALGVGVRVLDALPVVDRVPDALQVSLRVPLGDGVPVPLLKLVRVSDAVAVELLERVPVPLDESVPVSLLVLVTLRLPESLPEPLLELELVRLDELLRVRLPVPLTLGVDERVALDEQVSVTEELSVPVPVALLVVVMVTVPVCDGVTAEVMLQVAVVEALEEWEEEPVVVAEADGMSAAGRQGRAIMMADNAAGEDGA